MLGTSKKALIIDKLINLAIAYVLEQLVRLGVTYNGSLFSIAADLDLTENNAITFAEKSRLFTLGAEFNFSDWVAIRVGH